jgi:glycosyltransferase A (GT-A) superfamily protein (DUF2064 family)
VAVLGADSPTLPAYVIREAFDALDAADVSLGPSEDGGYYLLASRRVHPSLFREMIWSTDTVAQETIVRCEAAGLTLHLLPAWYDVDDSLALDRLLADLETAPPGIARHTRLILGTGAPPARDAG